MKFILITILILLLSCGGGGNDITDGGNDITDDGSRSLTEEEYIVWETVVGCFMDIGEPFINIEYREPRIIVVYNPSESGLCGDDPRIAACAPLAENWVVVRESSYLKDGILNAALFVHEFKHLILYQAGEDWGHESVWYSDSSPCPDNMLGD